LAAGSLAACGDADVNETVVGEGAETLAQEDVAMIEQRQANFEEIGDSFKTIRDQMEGGEPDFAVILDAAETIEVDAAKIVDFFPAGTGMDSGADTEALATIWEQPEEFAAAHERLSAAAAGLVAAAQAGEVAGMGPAIGELGNSCKNCHDTFRLDDE
jgi:cytochrome c556